MFEAMKFAIVAGQLRAFAQLTILLAGFRSWRREQSRRSPMLRKGMIRVGVAGWRRSNCRAATAIP
jgi:hypothetical protein